MVEQDPAWMTLEEVASYVRLSRSKLYDMAQAGEIPCSKVAGRWRFFRPEVDAWMLKQRPSSKGEPEANDGD